MTKNDFNAGQESGDQSDPLSATAMFLRSFDSAPVEEAKPDPWKTLSEPATAHAAAPSEQAPPSQAYSSPSQSAPAAGSSGPGEFTKMFQAQNQPASSPTPQAPPPSFTQAPPVPPPQAKPEFSAGFNPPQPPATGQGPGEFTRIFVAASTAPGEQSAKTIVEPPAFVPPPPPQAVSSASPQKLKGFSAPGVSDSASGEGSVTQFFKAATPSPSASPAPVSSATPPPAVQSYTPPPAAPVAETPWRRDDEFFKSTAPAEPASSMPGATGLLSTLSSPGASYGGSRPAEPVPYRPEPMPSYTPPPASSEPATPESGSVTKLIQRLSQVPREAPVEPPPPPLPAAPPVSSGPGEFTRMISGDLVKAAVAGGAPAAAAAPPPPAPAATGFPPMSAMPHPAMPAVPHPAIPAPVIPHAAPAPPPPAAPHLAAPHLAVPAIPKPAPPAIPAPALAAPKGKLEAMVPILLVINTFLLIVLLVVVVFAMKGK